MNQKIAMGLLLGAFWANGAAGSGREVGNGGDAYSQEFVSLGQSLGGRWDELGFKESLPVTKEKFLAAVGIVKIISTNEKLIVRGEEVDAINYPPCVGKETPEPHDCGKIKLNRARWDALRGKRHRKVALVLHEYLGALGSEDRRFDDYYETTGPLLAKLQKVLAEKPLVEVNFSCRVERWDAKAKAPVVAALIDTYGVSEREELKLGARKVFPAYFISLAKVGSDFLATVQIDRLEYRVSKRLDPYSQLEGETLSHGFVQFTVNGKNSQRVFSAPELEMTCYRTLDQVNPPSDL